MTWKTGDADEFLEDIMTEHVCKFYVAYPVGGRDYRCKCGRAATPQEIVAKLNTTERLNAGIAELMDDCKDDPNEMGGPFVSLSWIVNILEGKDET